jgi:hypothetical protein
MNTYIVDFEDFIEHFYPYKSIIPGVNLSRDKFSLIDYISAALVTLQEKATYCSLKLYLTHQWRGGRVADCGSLENC